MKEMLWTRRSTLWTLALAVGALVLLSQAPGLASTASAPVADEAPAEAEAPAPSLCLGIDDPTEAAIAGCSICLDSSGIGARCCCNASGSQASCSCTGSGNRRVCTCSDADGTVRCAYTSNGSDCACKAVVIVEPGPDPEPAER